MSRGVFFALSLLVFTFFAGSGRAADKYALLVGVTRYQHARMNDSNLQCPEADAQAVAELLKKSGYTVDLLLGKDASQASVQEALKRFSGQGADEGAAVVGLFGHGVQYGDDAYFAPYDTKLRLVTDSQG